MRQSFEKTDTGVSPSQGKAGRGSRQFKLVLAAAIIVSGAIAVSPFFISKSHTGPGGERRPLIVKTHDIENLLPAIQEFDAGLRSGLIYPRWFAETNKRYGVATGIFYPPGILYLTSFANRLTGNWIYALYLICALSLIGSGFAMYYVASRFYGAVPGTIAALVYMLLPYHMLDLYWRGAIPEFAGFVFMPLVLYAVHRLGVEGRLRHYAAVGLLHGLYLMTHIPVGYIFTYVLAFYTLVWAVRSRDPRIALRVAGGMALALVLSAVYVLPAALEGKYVYEWASEVFPYHKTYLTLLPEVDPFNVMMNNTFTIQAVLLLTLVVTLKRVPPPAKETELLQTRLWIIMGIAATFMATSFSIHISRLIPNIQIAVPPFRWLAISSVFIALLTGAVAERLSRREDLRPRPLWLYRGAAGVAIAATLWLTAQGVIVRALSNPLFEPRESVIEPGFTPKNARRPADLPETPLAMMNRPGATVEVIRWEPQTRQVAVRTDSEGLLRLRTYNFPGWTARINGEQAPVATDPDGAMIVQVPAGISRVDVSFENTAPRTIGAVCFMIAAVAILGLLLIDFIRTRRARKESQIPDRA